MSREPESLIGRWAVCAHGRLGRIEHHEERAQCWHGVGIDGTPWQSGRPQVLCRRDAVMLTAWLQGMAR